MSSRTFTVHRVVANEEESIHAEGAHAISTLLVVTNDTGDRGDIVHWEGGYEDTFEKTADGWRFKSRVHVWPEIEWTDRPQDMPLRNMAEE